MFRTALIRVSLFYNIDTGWWCREAPCLFLARRREFCDPRIFLWLRCEIGRRLHCYSAFLYALYRSWTARSNLVDGIVSANTCRVFDWTHRCGVCDLSWFCRDHMLSSQLPEMSTFVIKVESSASVVIFREHLGNLNPNAFCQHRRI